MKRAVSHMDASAAASQFNQCSRSAAAGHPHRSPRSATSNGGCSTIGGPKLKRCKSACINLKRLANPAGSPADDQSQSSGGYPSMFLPRWRQHASSPDVSMTFASSWGTTGTSTASSIPAVSLSAKSGRANCAGARVFGTSPNNTNEEMNQNSTGIVAGPAMGGSPVSAGVALLVGGPPGGCIRNSSFAAALNSFDPVPEGEVSSASTTMAGPSPTHNWHQKSRKHQYQLQQHQQRHRTTSVDATTVMRVSVGCGGYDAGFGAIHKNEGLAAFPLATISSEVVEDVDYSAGCCASPGAVSVADAERGCTGGSPGGDNCFSIVGFGDVDLDDDDDSADEMSAADVIAPRQQQHQQEVFGPVWGSSAERRPGVLQVAEAINNVDFVDGRGFEKSPNVIPTASATSIVVCSSAFAHQAAFGREAQNQGVDAAHVLQPEASSSHAQIEGGNVQQKSGGGEREPQSAMLMMRLQRRFEDMMLVSRVAT